MEVEAEAAKFFEEKSGSGNGSGAEDLEVEAERFLRKNLQMEAEAIFKKIKTLKAEADVFSKSTPSKTLVKAAFSYHSVLRSSDIYCVQVQ